MEEGVSVLQRGGRIWKHLKIERLKHLKIEIWEAVSGCNRLPLPLLKKTNMEDMEGTIIRVLRVVAAFVVGVAVCALLTLLTGCRSVRYVSVPEYHTEYKVRVDSVLRRDSVWVRDSVAVRDCESDEGLVHDGLKRKKNSTNINTYKLENNYD